MLAFTSLVLIMAAPQDRPERKFDRDLILECFKEKCEAEIAARSAKLPEAKSVLNRMENDFEIDRTAKSVDIPKNGTITFPSQPVRAAAIKKQKDAIAELEKAIKEVYEDPKIAIKLTRNTAKPMMKEKERNKAVTSWLGQPLKNSSYQGMWGPVSGEDGDGTVIAKDDKTCTIEIRETSQVGKPVMVRYSIDHTVTAALNKTSKAEKVYYVSKKEEAPGVITFTLITLDFKPEELFPKK